MARHDALFIRGGQYFTFGTYNVSFRRVSRKCPLNVSGVGRQLKREMKKKHVFGRERDVATRAVSLGNRQSICQGAGVFTRDPRFPASITLIDPSSALRAPNRAGSSKYRLRESTQIDHLLSLASFSDEVIESRNRNRHRYRSGTRVRKRLGVSQSRASATFGVVCAAPIC